MKKNHDENFDSLLLGIESELVNQFLCLIVELLFMYYNGLGRLTLLRYEA